MKFTVLLSRSLLATIVLAVGACSSSQQDRVDQAVQQTVEAQRAIDRAVEATLALVSELEVETTAKAAAGPTAVPTEQSTVKMEPAEKIDAGDRASDLVGIWSGSPIFPNSEVDSYESIVFYENIFWLSEGVDDMPWFYFYYSWKDNETLELSSPFELVTGTIEIVEMTPETLEFTINLQSEWDTTTAKSSQLHKSAEAQTDSVESIEDAIEGGWSGNHSWDWPDPDFSELWFKRLDNDRYSLFLRNPETMALAGYIEVELLPPNQIGFRDEHEERLSMVGEIVMPHPDSLIILLLDVPSGIADEIWVLTRSSGASAETPSTAKAEPAEKIHAGDRASDLVGVWAGSPVFPDSEFDSYDSIVFYEDVIWLPDSMGGIPLYYSWTDNDKLDFRSPVGLATGTMEILSLTPASLELIMDYRSEWGSLRATSSLLRKAAELEVDKVESIEEGIEGWWTGTHALSYGDSSFREARFIRLSTGTYSLSMRNPETMAVTPNEEVELMAPNVIGFRDNNGGLRLVGEIIMPHPDRLIIFQYYIDSGMPNAIWSLTRSSGAGAETP